MFEFMIILVLMIMIMMIINCRWRGSELLNKADRGGISIVSNKVGITEMHHKLPVIH